MAPVESITVEPPSGEIDRKSPIPVYFQLALLFEHAIRQGKWQAGDKLPSEFQICEHYGLSRTTVRQTLGWMENEGLIIKHRGAGSFVQGMAERAWQLSSSAGFFEEEALKKGHNVTSEVLRAERGPLPGWASTLLRLSEGSEGATLERVRAMNGHKAIYVVNHLASEYADVALDFTDPNESLYLRLRERARVEPRGADRTLKALSASAGLAEILEVERGHPLIFIQSVSWDRFKTPFDCYRAWVVSEIAPIEIRVTAVPEEPSA